MATIILISTQKAATTLQIFFCVVFVYLQDSNGNSGANSGGEDDDYHAAE